ncbi:hypothetical protein [Rubricoccus marinus]|uniref:SH3 domain-containing protein n=1 Tax=Rubricoccus marinus TaxID=716817 RepID=A0A259U257_9BACT|nr:hypothetical protein [Rubricoccus marinus]OZC04051.1 hypothetical protein BSZ36_14290 [Rubricoccus marinus]
MPRLSALALVLALAACEPAPDAPEPEASPAPAEVTPEAAPAMEASTISADDSTSARLTAPVRVDGACPFEGCMYGTWTASGETAVYTAAGDTTSRAFTVPAGTEIEADRGFALVTRLGQILVERDAVIYLASGGEQPVAAGDTLLVLDPEGEGSSRVWANGVLGFSGVDVDMNGPGGEGPALRTLRPAEYQWWAHVRLADGREGWLWMDRTPSVSGADAFG